MVYVFLFIFGLIIGSFLNVVIHRLQTGENIVKSRSHCPNCKHILAPKDLVPIFSYLWLRGKCRYCRECISSQYILVELVTAILFVLGYFMIISQAGVITSLVIIQFVYYLIVVSFLLVIFVFDHLHGLILDKVSIPLMVVALIFAFILKLNIVHVLLSGLIGATWFGWQYFLSQGKWVGGGDIRLGAVMGLLLGWPGIVTALFIAYLLGAVVGVYLLLTHKKERQSQIAFGTFLSLATVVTWLWGAGLLNWYLGLFG